MFNPATLSRLELNAFTRHVKETNAWVKLRNGKIVQPIWREAEANDDTCEPFFHWEYTLAWQPNGVSMNNSSFDMMELVYA